MCSTPFGINELFTGDESGGGAAGVCAQRLSASTNCSHYRDGKARRIGSCSTPFGINELFTVCRPRPDPAILVLNAFRNQRTVHLGMADASCQQLVCSTPFGINELFTGRNHSRPTDPSHVLNAFRHQRTVHCCDRLTSDTRSVCAQRLSASTNCSRSCCP